MNVRRLHVVSVLRQLQYKTNHLCICTNLYNNQSLHGQEVVLASLTILISILWGQHPVIFSYMQDDFLQKQTSQTSQKHT